MSGCSVCGHSVRSRALFGLVIVFIALVAGGCWDYVDLERRSLVMAIGLDVNPDDPGKMLLSTEIPVPLTANPDAGGGGDGPKKLILTSSAGSLVQAANDLRGELQRHPLWDQTIAIIVSEELARDGIGRVMDVIIRFPRMNRRALLFISEDRSEGLLHFEPIMQPLVATHLRGLADQFMLHPRFAQPQEIVGIHAELHEQGVVLIPRVTVDDGWLRLSGAAVIADGQLVGWLDAAQAEGANWLLGHVLRSLVEITCPGHPEGHIGAWVRLHRHSIRTSIENGLPHFDIRLSITARLIDLARCPIEPESPSDRRNISAELIDTVKMLTDSAVARAQREFQVDYLRLREQLRRNFPMLMDDIDWKRLFPDARISVDVTMAPGGIVFPGESLRTVPYR